MHIIQRRDTVSVVLVVQAASDVCLVEHGSPSHHSSARCSNPMRLAQEKQTFKTWQRFSSSRPLWPYCRTDEELNFSF